VRGDSTGESVDARCRALLRAERALDFADDDFGVGRDVGGEAVDDAALLVDQEFLEVPQDLAGPGAGRP
jgi:hypothetical protein